MREYLTSGLHLGWLINPQGEEIEVYRRNKPMELIKLPASLSGEDILPGFVLDLPLF